MTLGEALRASAEYLERKGVDSPRLDAELLFAHALDLSRIELYTHHDRPLNEREATAARALVERRGRREPLAYVLGEWGFRHLTLRTDARALVPRPETEIVVERALARIAGAESPRVIDVGTGTGAIALAIAQERPDARVVATDLSPDALALARENAERLALAVELVHADLLEGMDGRFDIVVSNPPYVHGGEELPAELAFEPRGALYDEGQTGRLVDDARRLLDGWLVLEVHAHGADDVAALARDRGYRDVSVTLDLAGRPRVVEARWTP
ncbi:MAG: peptide chain release factor N(5)-glutamine methyltransferase [Actinobacteria bacterium]|nr:peptide chain release factor N(5)-glutamine methyltransferase [Actinomycetota bacterium]